MDPKVVFCVLMVLVLPSNLQAKKAKKAPKVDADCPQEWPERDPPCTNSRYYVSAYSREAYPIFSRLTTDLGNARDDIDRLQKGRRCLKQQLDVQDAKVKKKFTKQAKKHQDDFETLKAEIDQMKTHHATEIEALKTNHSTEMKTLRTSLETTRTSLETTRTSLQTTIDDQALKNKELEDRLKDLNKTVIFSATGNSPSFSSGHTLTWENINTNIGNAFNSATGVFKAPVDGIYVFDLSLLAYASKGSWFGAWLMKDTKLMVKVTAESAGHWHRATATLALPLKAGQTVYAKNKYNGLTYACCKFNSFRGMLVKYTP